MFQSVNTAEDGLIPVKGQARPFWELGQSHVRYRLSWNMSRSICLFFVCFALFKKIKIKIISPLCKHGSNYTTKGN